MTTRRALLAPALAAAQAAWPSRPVTVIVPWAADGSTDFLARVLCQRLAADLGQPFVVENRPGASGTVGHAAVSRARPDGTLFLIGANGTCAMAPHPMENLGYDTETGFAPIGLLARAEHPHGLRLRPFLSRARGRMRA